MLSGTQIVLSKDKDQGKRKRPEPLVCGGFGLYLLGAPGRNRTYDSRIRNPVLYPLSYEGNALIYIIFCAYTMRVAK